MGKLELIVDKRAILGEGPSWDSAKGLLYWIDIIGKKVHIYDPVSNLDREIEADQYIGAVVPSVSGKLILAMQNGFYSLDLETEEFTIINDPEQHLPGNRFNDGKCDAAGRFWAGTMSLTDEPNQGSLYCLNTDHSVQKAFDEVSTSNGLAWNSDNTVMYYIDTPTQQVVAFDYTLEKGELSNKRTVIDFTNEKGYPDGMTIDSEGMLWIAHWQGYQLSRWNPNTGEKLDSIPVPVERVTSAVFGGENLDELYITTASIGLDEEGFEKYPQSGGLFRINVGIRGTETFRYKG